MEKAKGNKKKNEEMQMMRRRKKTNRIYMKTVGVKLE
jgi:hypothetical protein